MNTFIWAGSRKKTAEKQHGIIELKWSKKKASAATTKTMDGGETTTNEKQNKSSSVRLYLYIIYIDPEPSETNADGWCLAYELTCMSMCVYALLHLDNACTLCCSALFSSLFFPLLYSIGSSWPVAVQTWFLAPGRSTLYVYIYRFLLVPFFCFLSFFFFGDLSFDINRHQLIWCAVLYDYHLFLIPLSSWAFPVALFCFGMSFASDS